MVAQDAHRCSASLKSMVHGNLQMAQLNGLQMTIHGIEKQICFTLNNQQVLDTHIVTIKLTQKIALSMMIPMLKTIYMLFLLGSKSTVNTRQMIFMFQESHMLVYMYHT